MQRVARFLSPARRLATARPSLAPRLLGAPLAAPRHACTAPPSARNYCSTSGVSTSAAPCTVEDVAGWLHSELGSSIVALDVRETGGLGVEHLVFATARSRAHMQRIAGTVQIELKNRGVVRFEQAPFIEGRHSDDWLLVDGGSVVVSVMVTQARDRLQLEEHWLSLGATPVELPAALRGDVAVEAGPPPAATAVAAAAAGVGASVPHWGSARDDDGGVYREDEAGSLEQRAKWRVGQEQPDADECYAEYAEDADDEPLGDESALNRRLRRVELERKAAEEYAEEFEYVDFYEEGSYDESLEYYYDGDYYDGDYYDGDYYYDGDGSSDG